VVIAEHPAGSGHRYFEKLMKVRWLTLLALLGACAPRSSDQQNANAPQSDSAQAVNTNAMNNNAQKPIAEVLAAHTPIWMRMPGVTGAGETQKDGKPAIVIIVDTMTESLSAQLPRNVEGYPVVFKESGKIQAR
jgi:hypothetical protein